PPPPPHPTTHTHTPLLWCCLPSLAAPCAAKSMAPHLKIAGLRLHGRVPPQCTLPMGISTTRHKPLTASKNSVTTSKNSWVKSSFTMTEVCVCVGVCGQEGWGGIEHSLKGSRFTSRRMMILKTNKS
ncbi:hypothetical protein T492DRAFT_966280, partial [Pavlovales sp. CCMP2436]